MKKTTFLIVACLIVAGCEKPKPDLQPSTPHIDWAPEATAAQREMIVDMLNDMIYVEPTKKRARESTANGNVFASPSFWISTASAITTLISTILLIQQRVK